MWLAEPCRTPIKSGGVRLDRSTCRIARGKSQRWGGSLIANPHVGPAITTTCAGCPAVVSGGPHLPR